VIYLKPNSSGDPTCGSKRRSPTNLPPRINLATLAAISPGGSILDGTYDQQTYGFALTVTPIRQLYFSGAFTYGFSHAFTSDNNDPSIVPYRGDIYTLTAAATYALDAKSSLQASYSYSSADYNQNNGVAGVPLGLNYTRHDLTFSVSRKFTPRFSGVLRYAFSQYSEPGSGSANNYSANGVFCFVTYKLN
jgi:hypothetical protein